MRTNLGIFEEIKKTGFITKSDLQLLKNRSNKSQKDLFNYDLLENQDIRITPDQGAQGLKWLQSFAKSGIFGNRVNIVLNSTCEDFIFKGFWDAGNKSFSNFLPIYELNGLEYIPLKTPYIIG